MLKCITSKFSNCSCDGLTDDFSSMSQDNKIAKKVATGHQKLMY